MSLSKVWMVVKIELKEAWVSRSEAFWSKIVMKVFLMNLTMVVYL